MSLIRPRKLRSLVRLNSLCGATMLITLSACGSESTGPATGTLDSDAALRSLALGFGPVSGAAYPFPIAPTSMAGSSRQLDQITVAIDGVSHTMYALGLRVTYPSGTCFEALFIVPLSVGFYPSTCTPPPLGLAVILWQTRSASRPPDRIALISADIGTSDFGFLSSDFDLPQVFPAFAIYSEARDNIWFSVAGSLTSQVAATGETCAIPPPPFAKSSTCSVATFDEAGSIDFQRAEALAFVVNGNVNPGPVMRLTIPRQTIRGILQAITEIAPITLPAR